MICCLTCCMSAAAEEDVTVEIAVSQAVAALADRCVRIESVNLSSCALVRSAEFAEALANIWCSSGRSGRHLYADVCGSQRLLLLVTAAEVKS